MKDFKKRVMVENVQEKVTENLYFNLIRESAEAAARSCSGLSFKLHTLKVQLYYNTTLTQAFSSEVAFLWTAASGASK